jgi:hypothetical protein
MWILSYCHLRNKHNYEKLVKEKLIMNNFVLNKTFSSNFKKWSVEEAGE